MLNTTTNFPPAWKTGNTEPCTTGPPSQKSIAELGVMFTKMSSLISQQGEVLEGIEDDVEAAGMDIDAGYDEFVKTYGMTKGNRGLILKVFGV